MNITKVAIASPTSSTVDTAKSQRNRATQKHLEKDLEKDMWTVGFRCS